MTARDAIPPLASVASLDTNKLLDAISRQWDADIVPQLIEYVKLPAKSPGFDHDWARHGFLDAAIEQARKWVLAPSRMTYSVAR